MDRQAKDVFEPASTSNGEDAKCVMLYLLVFLCLFVNCLITWLFWDFYADKQRAALIEWLNSSFSDVSLSVNASDEDLRAFLIDGSVLCRILNKVKPGSVIEVVGWS